jgi:hypothetical protein
MREQIINESLFQLPIGHSTTKEKNSLRYALTISVLSPIVQSFLVPARLRQSTSHVATVRDLSAHAATTTHLEGTVAELTSGDGAIDPILH